MTLHYRLKIFILCIIILWGYSLFFFWNTSQTETSNVSLEELNTQLSNLKKQYESITNTAKLLKYLQDINVNEKKILNEAENFSTVIIARDPIEEMLLRRVRTNLRELMDFYKSFVNENDVNKESMEDRIRMLMADSELISEGDISQSWRKKGLVNLEKLLKSRIESNQNPVNCNTAKKLICNLNKGCGFGCQMHHATYCLILAYSTQRTLILETSAWRYSNGGWNYVFEPLSTNCTQYNGGSGTITWGVNDMNQYQNVKVPIVDTLQNRPNILPQAIPSDIYEQLSKLHSDPFVWFIGQFISYILRLNDRMNMLLNSSQQGLYSQIPIMGPIVGVHVRRTDKIGTEAQFHGIEEYMEHVEEFFEKEEIKANLKIKLGNLAKMSGPYNYQTVTLKRQIVLATDEPKIFSEMKVKYPNYYVIGNMGNSETASMGQRYTSSALEAIIFDTFFLSQTNFLVCTFSSQVCRLAYELMQTKILQSPTGDQGNKFKSLDDIYYFGGQLNNNMVIIRDFVAPNKGKKILAGSTVKVMGNHWNGFSKGSFENNVILFPTYKAQFLHILSEMGKYNKSNYP